MRETSFGFAARRPGLLPLTGIRFLAASYVVMFHTKIPALLYRSGHDWAGNFFNNGYLAVTFFFLLSGFILAYTYAGKVGTETERVHFWAARVARVWPTYVVALALSSFPGWKIPQAGHAIATLLMVQAWDPWDPELASTWNGMAWTLSVEAFFYLIFPLLQRWLDRRTRQTLWIVLVADLLLAVGCNVSAHGLDAQMYPGVLRFIPFPIIHLPEFVAGAVLGNVFLRSERPVTTSGWTFAAVGLTAVALMLPSGPWTSLALIAFAVLVYSLARERTLVARVLSTRLLLFGGAISYAMYLLQWPVRQWVHPWISSYSSIPWQVGIVPAVLVALSALVYRYIEDPARHLILAHLDRAQPGTAQA
jgi:peptidoglycan/LPS O-acetylase OafA/YrhL